MNVSPPAASTATPYTFQRKGLAVAMLAVIALGAGLVLAQVRQPAAPPVTATEMVGPPAPAKLETVTVERGDISQTVGASGKLQLFKYVDANAKVAGQIKQVLVAVGDQVKSGETMLEITPTLQPAKLESSRTRMALLQAELAGQRAQLDYAELQFKRQTQLKAQNATREDTFESSRMSVSSANARMDSINAQISQVEATLKIDEDRLQHTLVMAPISGTVVALGARAGQVVEATPATTPLMRIADLSKMTVQARVAEIDVTKLRRGMTANFTTPGYPGQHWSGKLRRIIPVPADDTGEQGKKTFYNVLFEVDNADQDLMSGMSTDVKFVVAQAKDAVLVPASLLGNPDKDGLYSVKVLSAQRQPTVRKLKIGVRNEQQAQVLSGLSAGEQLLIGPVSALLPQQQPAADVPGTAHSALAANRAAASMAAK